MEREVRGEEGGRDGGIDRWEMDGVARKKIEGMYDLEELCSSSLCGQHPVFNHAAPEPYNLR